MDRFQQIQNIKYFFRSIDHRDGIDENTPRIVLKLDPDYVAPATSEDDEKPATSNGERVSKTWENAEIAAKRNTRDGVKVTVEGFSTTHKSTFAAFQDHELPEKFHVKFRAELKRDRVKHFLHEGVDYLFELIPLDQVAQ